MRATPAANGTATTTSSGPNASRTTRRSWRSPARCSAADGRDLDPSASLAAKPIQSFSSPVPSPPGRRCRCRPSSRPSSREPGCALLDRIALEGARHGHLHPASVAGVGAPAGVDRGLGLERQGVLRSDRWHRRVGGGSGGRGSGALDGAGAGRDELSSHAVGRRPRSARVSRPLTRRGRRPASAHPPARGETLGSRSAGGQPASSDPSGQSGSARAGFGTRPSKSSQIRRSSRQSKPRQGIGRAS